MGRWDRQRESGIRLLTVILVILFILLQIKLWFSDGSLVDVWRLEQQLQAQKNENELLRSRNRALEAEVKDLKQGLEAIEERSRSELGMIRKGETFYQIIDGESPDEK
jgi:cell division protein FtsB